MSDEREVASAVNWVAFVLCMVVGVLMAVVLGLTHVVEAIDALTAAVVAGGAL